MMTDPPAHDLDLGDQQWWACSRPEHPFVQNEAYYDLRCKPCAIAQVAAIESGRFSSTIMLIGDNGDVEILPPDQWLNIVRPQIREAHGF